MKKTLSMLVIAINVFAGESTGVGSGGDVVDRLIFTSRQALIQSLYALQVGFDTNDFCECRTPIGKDISCDFLNSLTGDQRRFCREFLFSTMDQYWQLNTVSPVTKLIPTLQTLIVEGRPVAAMTPLGPEGDVLLHYGSLRSFWPTTLLALLGHEFGHKVRFRGGFISDASPIGPFNFPEGGRILLDAVGAGFAQYAAAHGWVGTYQGVEDRFKCSVAKVSTPCNGPRLYYGNPAVYETGIGNLPKDVEWEYAQTEKGPYLRPRILIHEEQGCRAKVDPKSRWTLLELWQVSDQGRKKTRLSQVLLEGYNPICGDSGTKDLVLSYDDLKFQFSYVGSRRGYSRRRR